MTAEKKRQEEVFEKKRLVVQERDHSTQARVPRKGITRDGAAVKVSCSRSSESLGCKVEVICAKELAAKITKFFSAFSSPHTTTTRADRVDEVNADRQANTCAHSKSLKNLDTLNPLLFVCVSNFLEALADSTYVCI